MAAVWNIEKIDSLSVIWLVSSVELMLELVVSLI
jgi:hypothetical protein